MRSRLRYVFTVLLCFSVTTLAQVDLSVSRAPQWDCSRPGAPQVIWRKVIGHHAGPSAALSDVVVASAISPGRLATSSMMAFDRSGRPLWKLMHAHLPQRIHDMGQGIRSRPLIDGRRMYYVSNRGELMCVDLDGFVDGENDGPFLTEPDVRPAAADVVWKLDMMAELGVFKREAGDVGNPVSSPIIIGDNVYCVTGHGSTGEHGMRRGDALAPSFIAVEKRTGKLAWSSSAPGTNIIYGQWSSPVYARIAGQDVVIFPGGDGWLYGFEARRGALLWKLDCNEAGRKDWMPWGGGQLTDYKDFFVAPPVVADGTLYVGLNKDFEMSGLAPLLAVELAPKHGEPKIKWKFSSTNFSSTYTAAAASGGIVFVMDRSCVVFALDARTGRELWHSRVVANGSALYANLVIRSGRLYAADDTGLTVFTAARDKRCLGRYEFGQLYPQTPVVLNDRIYISAGDSLWALHLPSSPFFEKLRKFKDRILP